MHKHNFRASHNVGLKHYDGKNKQVNKLTLKIMFWGFIFLLYLAWLGSQGVVFHF